MDFFGCAMKSQCTYVYMYTVVLHRYTCCTNATIIGTSIKSLPLCTPELAFNKVYHMYASYTIPPRTDL